MLISCISSSEILRDFLYVVDHVLLYQKNVVNFCVAICLRSNYKMTVLEW